MRIGKNIQYKENMCFGCCLNSGHNCCCCRKYFTPDENNLSEEGLMKLSDKEFDNYYEHYCKKDYDIDKKYEGYFSINHDTFASHEDKLDANVATEIALTKVRLSSKFLQIIHKPIQVTIMSVLFFIRLFLTISLCELCFLYVLFMMILSLEKMIYTSDLEGVNVVKTIYFFPTIMIWYLVIRYLALFNGLLYFMDIVKVISVRVVPDSSKELKDIHSLAKKQKILDKANQDIFKDTGHSMIAVKE
ncbi:MAG: hypothetical protein MHMPM18_000602 [Marteilia pararefringens]